MRALERGKVQSIEKVNGKKNKKDISISQGPQETSKISIQSRTLSHIFISSKARGNNKTNK